MPVKAAPQERFAKTRSVHIAKIRESIKNLHKTRAVPRVWYDQNQRPSISGPSSTGEASMNDFMASNLKRWNELAGIHADSAFYDVAGFKRGQTSLKAIELAELGDAAGVALLHLQCHFGLDTLSWARQGARVTGVDFSDEAITRARSLAAETGIAADFLCADVLDLQNRLHGLFDIVFTSYGVLLWLPDLGRWGQTIAHFLKPGGIFCMVEVHPFAYLFDQADAQSNLTVAFSYFHETEPLRFEVQGTYADRSASVEHRMTNTWQHGLGDILNALTAAGLHIDFVHEFPFSIFPMVPSMTQGNDGWWRLPGKEMLPLLFSVRAVKQ
jgi:2-polyprenyl-3-methyl-5-hydroxy-6-metoxy-1,4-benzoquinol methylase